MGEVAGGIVDGPFKYGLVTCVWIASVKDCIEEGAEFLYSILRLGTEAKIQRTFSIINPMMTPGGWHEWGGRY